MIWPDRGSAVTVWKAPWITFQAPVQQRLHNQGEYPMKTLNDAFEHTLEDIYWAENALSKALPKVSKAVSSAELKKAMDDHLKETKGHIKTLEAVFKSIGKEAKGEKCDARALVSPAAIRAIALSP